MKQNIIILYTNAFKYTRRDGTAAEGINVSYIQSESLEATSNGDEKGYQVISGNLPYNCLPDIKTVPAVYEGTFELRMVRNSFGQQVASLQLRKIDYLNELS